MKQFGYRELEDIVKRKGLKIARRVQHRGWELYLCDGYSGGSLEEPKPHFKTLYAVGYDPSCIYMVEYFTTPVVFPIQSMKDRLDAAEARAKEYVDNIELIRAEEKNGSQSRTA